MDRAELIELIRAAYHYGYCDGQNNPNGYVDNKDVSDCIRELIVVSEEDL